MALDKWWGGGYELSKRLGNCAGWGHGAIASRHSGGGIRGPRLFGRGSAEVGRDWWEAEWRLRVEGPSPVPCRCGWCGR
ncbi:hypothetical protein [Devosia sp. DBB001]|nr:hypothetical protein [Devosia sp. DBB001]